MSPRRYRMHARAEAVGATRGRIVEAAKELHATQGVVATNWEEIAARAGVSSATVYRHFPTLAELILACARSVFDLIRPPTLAEAGVKFQSLRSPGDRLEHLVRDSIRCYREGEGWLHAAHRERDFVPPLDAALRVIESSLAVLVSAAAGRRLRQADIAALVVLCGFPFWKSLVDQGMSHSAAQSLVVRLVRSEVSRLGLDTRRL